MSMHLTIRKGLAVYLGTRYLVIYLRQVSIESLIVWSLVLVRRMLMEIPMLTAG